MRRRARRDRRPHQPPAPRPGRERPARDPCDGAPGTATRPRAVPRQPPGERALARVEARHERGEQQQERQAVEQEAHYDTGTLNVVVYSSKSETRSVTVTVHLPPGANDMALAT
jgi:hypothetical protein